MNVSDNIYVETNVPLFEAIYGKGLISLGGLEAIDDMFLDVALTGKTILDIGSGIGGMAYHLAAQYDCQVIGLEIHPWMAEYATNHAPSSIKNKLEFISYTPDGEIPIGAQSIDICCSKGVLTNVKGKLKLFQECYRILQHSGQIVFIDWLVPESAGPKYDRLRMGDMSFKETKSSYIQQFCTRQDSKMFNILIKAKNIWNM
jgi:ubiquinone/menaquinone biosynthesis C-methylase UbiE